MLKNRLHPGHFLQKELIDREISQVKLAQHIKVAPGVINLICNGKRNISPEMAKKLASALGTTAELWMNLQNSYDLSKVADPSFGKLRA